MCNLYTVNVSANAIADAFKARMPTAFNAAQGDVYPGAPGMVVREADGGAVVPAQAFRPSEIAPVPAQLMARTQPL